MMNEYLMEIHLTTATDDVEGIIFHPPQFLSWHLFMANKEVISFRHSLMRTYLYIMWFTYSTVMYLQSLAATVPVHRAVSLFLSHVLLSPFEDYVQKNVSLLIFMET